MLPKILKPEKEYDLVRLGSINDGGYLVDINSIKKSKALVSFGLGFNWSFEESFTKINPVIVHCYDYYIKPSHIKKHSLKSLLNFFNLKNYSINFFKSNISRLFLYKNYKSFFCGFKQHFRKSLGIGPNLISLTDALLNTNSDKIFLKIDIEGSEYRVLYDILENQSKLTGLVIEFHNLDLHLNEVINFIKNFKLKLVHIHGQNPGGKNFLDKKGDPTLIELTFAENPIIKGDKVILPHRFDYPSDPRFDEVKLVFEN